MNQETSSPTDTSPSTTTPKPVSFFDDDDNKTPFTFTFPTIVHNKSLSMPAVLMNKLFFKQTTSKELIFAIHNNLLCQYENEKDPSPRVVLTLSHSRLRYIKPLYDHCDHGFSLTKNGIILEFYNKDKQVIDAWFEALKRHTVLSTFHDDYKAIKMIGRGSFAKVYLVESKVTGKSFAVKAFTKDAMNVSNKANAKPSMLNEIDIMRSVDHENLIKLYEVYETDKSIYLVLELIQGKSLYDYIKKSNFRAEEGFQTKINNITRSLLDALSYLSAKGIMHRDLKPDNILLDQGNKVKIVDFGLATFIDLDTYIFKKCGTPGYIAPEVFKYDEKERTTFYHDRCDVFSVGCLLYYMTYNAPMFEAPTAPDILRKNRAFAITSPLYDSLKKDLSDPACKHPKDAVSLIIDLVEFDQHKRISASQALLHPYFVPVPSGMNRIPGTNEFMVEALTTHTSNEDYSPCSPLKMPKMSYDQVFSPLTPLRMDLIDSPMAPAAKDRFKDDGSMYLDMGRPDITGRVDTVVNGSNNNSLLFINRGESVSNCASPCLKSAFSNRNPSRSATKQYKSSGAQSFLKAAIFRNMQKNSSEGAREDDNGEVCSPKILPFGELSSPGCKSPAMRLYGCSEVVEQAGQEQEEEGTINKIQLNLGGDKSEGFEAVGHGKTVGESALGKARRFQPFASNLIIPKHGKLEF